jgi:hypothetical protein
VVPYDGALGALGHHEVDRLHGLAGGLKITRAGGGRLGPALLRRDRNPAARLAWNAFKRGNRRPLYALHTGARVPKAGVDDRAEIVQSFQDRAPIDNAAPEAPY